MFVKELKVLSVSSELRELATKLASGDSTRKSTLRQLRKLATDLVSVAKIDEDKFIQTLENHLSSFPSPAFSSKWAKETFNTSWFLEAPAPLKLKKQVASLLLRDIGPYKVWSDFSHGTLKPLPQSGESNE